MSAVLAALTAMQAGLQLAEEYDIPVFPCQPNKRPFTEHGFKDATTSLHAIEQAWTEHPNALVGVPTGRASRIDVVDIDPAGLDWYRDHADRLAAGRIHRTQRQGFHLLYRAPEIEIRNSAGELATGVDVRGEGGYIIWWPAHGLESVGSLEDLTTPPEWLIEQLTETKRAEQTGGPPAEDGRFISEGQRNDFLSREAYRLRKNGANVEQALETLRALNRTHCRPPLEDEELANLAAGKKRVLPDTVTAEDFYAYMPQHSYIFVASRELWPAASVNARVMMTGAKASEWLDQHRPVDQMTWAPGLPMLIENKLVSGGGWIERQGSNTFNLYIPPQPVDGDASKVGPWLDHLQRVFKTDAEHIALWLAHRVQRPGEKINHALLLGGSQGIGKDTILEPVKHAIGPWNFAEVSPPQLLGRFNGFVKSVILRVSEARDLGDVDRYSFYEHMKVYTAAPPDVLRCDEKNLREHAVMNVTGVIITSNHKTDGIYLPADDRRHYVAWSELIKEQFSDDYWRTLWRWYGEGGIGHVVAYLRSLDLTSFDPRAPPPKTAAFWDIVDANRAPEDGELADVLETLGNPAATTLTDICIYASESFREWLKDRRNSRLVPHRFEAVGYVPVRNDSQKDGRWKMRGQNVVVYVRTELPVRDRIAAARALCSGSRP